MTPPLAALSLIALLAVTAAPAKPLFDPKPATIHGLRFGREQVFEGDAQVVFEYSSFKPIGSKAPPMLLRGWTGDQGEFHIRFIGRRTVQAGRYGHLGAYRHMVLITDMIDARPKP